MSRRVQPSDLLDQPLFGKRRGDGGRFDPAHLVDKGAGDGLIIGDDRQNFERRARKRLIFAKLERGAHELAVFAFGDKLGAVGI